MVLDGEEYFYVRNIKNDIIALTDKSGQQVVTYSYDTWGKLISIEGNLKDSVGIRSPYRYRGYKYDTETGMYYLQSRYYNPEWGRFISADIIAGTVGEILGHNVFIYCKNDPINMSDETGFRPKFNNPFQEETPEMERLSKDMWSKNRLQAASKSSGNIGRYIKTKVKKYGPSVIDCGIGHFGGKVVGNINSQKYKLINVQRGWIIGQTAKYDIKTIGRANFLNKTILNGLGVVATGLTIKQAVEDISEYGLAKGIGRTAVDLSGGIATAAIVGVATGFFSRGSE